MIIVTDLLKEPFDEGAKITAYHLVRQLKKYRESRIFSVNGNCGLDCIDYSFALNRLLWNRHFYQSLKEQDCETIFYLPESSLTLASLIRAKLLNFFTAKRVIVLSLQPRKYGGITRHFIKLIQPRLVITQSKRTLEYLKTLGLQCKLLPLGVDDNKFHEFDDFEKNNLRLRYNIAHDKKVLLHVGHIQQSRNLDWFLEIKSKFEQVNIIIVGSSYNRDDEQLYKRLTQNGVKIIDTYISRMEEIYNLADYYIFPVINSDGAIETPLSVLEAMACNIPIITTRFGSLSDTFEEDDCFHYVNTSNEIVSVLEKGKPSNCDNREKIKPFTWESVAQRLLGIIEGG